MRHWEYRTMALHPASVSLTGVNGWRLREINEQEQPDWEKSEIYPSTGDFCNQMSRDGWELISVGYPSYIAEAILYFRRLYH